MFSPSTPIRLAFLGILALAVLPAAAMEVHKSYVDGASILVGAPVVDFYLNQCEYDPLLEPEANAAKKVLGDAVLDAMKIRLEAAIGLWNDVGPDNGVTPTLVLSYAGLHPTERITDASDCLPNDPDDGIFLVTRSFGGFTSGLGTVSIEDPIGGDPFISECDITFHKDKWENTGQYAEAATVALGHEIGHCLGFGHSYLTRHTIDDATGQEAESIPSIMGYDRLGSQQIGEDRRVNPADEALFLRAYGGSQQPAGRFTITGRLVDCQGDEIFGAAVVAVEEVPTGERPAVQVRLSGYEGTVPAALANPASRRGDFALTHLESGKSYEVRIVDTHDATLFDPHGYDFNDDPGRRPRVSIFDLAVYDPANPGQGKFDAWDLVATGFTAKTFLGVTSTDPDLGDICIEHPSCGSPCP